MTLFKWPDPGTTVPKDFFKLRWSVRPLYYRKVPGHIGLSQVEPQ